MGVLEARPAEPEAIEQMIERLTGDRHAEVAHVGKIPKAPAGRVHGSGGRSPPVPDRERLAMIGCVAQECDECLRTTPDAAAASRHKPGPPGSRGGLEKRKDFGCCCIHLERRWQASHKLSR